MNLNEALNSIDSIAQMLRQTEQTTVLFENDNRHLKGENDVLKGQVEAMGHQINDLSQDNNQLKEQTLEQAQQIGELMASMRELLAQNMAIGSRAAELLRKMETKPEPLHPPTAQEEFKKTSLDERRDLNRAVKLVVETERAQALAEFAEGQEGYFIPPASYAERALIVYYRLHGNRGAPNKWRERPVVWVKKKNGDICFVKFDWSEPHKRKVQEVESQPPFRPVENKSETELPPEIVDDCGPIPAFLTKGPKVNGNADKRGEPGDI